MGSGHLICCNKSTKTPIAINIIPETNPNQSTDTANSPANKEDDAHLKFTTQDNPISFIINRNRIGMQYSFDQSALIQSFQKKIKLKKSSSAKGLKLTLKEKMNIIESLLVQMPKLKQSNIQSNFKFNSTIEPCNVADFEIINQPLNQEQIAFIKKILSSEDLLLKEMTDSIM